MSKSLNNSFYVKDFINKYGANVLKYIFYTKKYMQPLNITDNLISFVKTELAKIKNVIKKTELYIEINNLRFGHVKTNQI